MTDTEIKRGPGRPARVEEVQQARRRRTSLGADRNLKLHVPDEAKDPDFIYRFVNNRPGRVHQMTQADDWEQVSSADGRIDTGSSEGTVVKRVVDRSQGEEAVLLRKPRAYYEADKLEEQKLLDVADEQMRRGAAKGAEALSGSEAYVPGGRKGSDGRNVVSGK